MTRLLYLTDGSGAVGWYRCHIPGRALREAGNEVEFAQPEDAGADAAVRRADVVVFERPTRPAALRALQSAHRLGKRTIVDLDDDLWHVDPANPAHAVLSNGDALRVLEACLRMASKVTVSTDALKKIVMPLNRETTVLPNMLSRHEWGSCTRGGRGDRLVIGWAGSRHHLNDLRLLDGVVDSVVKRHKHVEFAFAGADVLPFRPHQRMRFLKSVPIEEYPGLVAEFDIGIAPLADSRFNQSKSDLKILEYGACGLPVVASKVDSYSGLIRHNENGLLAVSAKDWIRCLCRLVAEPELRASLGEGSRRLFAGRIIEDNVRLWEDAYQIA